MALSKTLVPLLSLFLLMLANTVRSQGDTTTFAFDSFSSSSKNLIYQGDAFVPSGSTSVRLTKTDASGKPEQYSVGRVVYSPPVQFWDQKKQASFQTTIKFVITTVDSIPADGITFFIIPVGSPIPNPSTGGSLGLFDLETGLALSVFAVEFDIFYIGDNAQWDPRYRHIGIDINSRTSRNVSRFEGALGQEVTAHINYFPSTRTISVLATYGSQKSSLTYVIDLKTILPQQVQVGVSAATGLQFALHDLRAWHFTSTLVYDGNNVDDTYIRKYV